MSFTVVSLTSIIDGPQAARNPAQQVSTNNRKEVSKTTQTPSNKEFVRDDAEDYDRLPNVKLGEAGLEPARSCERGILSPLRLPFRHSPMCGFYRGFKRLRSGRRNFRLPIICHSLPGSTPSPQPQLVAGRQQGWP